MIYSHLSNNFELDLDAASRMHEIVVIIWINICLFNSSKIEIIVNS